MNDLFVICIPGQWKSRTDLVQAIAALSDGYLFAGQIIMKLNSDEVFELEIYNHNTALIEAFRFASQGNFSEELLSQIGDHTFTLYVIGKTGCLENVQSITSVTKALLRSGGLAAKVENSGIAHSKTYWLSINQEYYYDLFNTYITYGREEKFYYSCGMHVFGLPDAIVEIHLVPEAAADLMASFLQYCLIENPELKNGQTFSMGTDTPIYELEKLECVHFDSNSLLHNPHGIWKLKEL